MEACLSCLKKRNCQRLYASHFLRNRPWVYCDQITGQCRDAISKKDWLDPSKRLPQCVQSVLKGETSENAPIQFCLLDDSRTELCNKVVQWNLQITTILCRAAGIFFFCPEFVDTPTQFKYSVSNQEFASDTVLSIPLGLSRDKIWREKLFLGLVRHRT